MKIRAAIYARVSSAAQRERHTIENQLRVLPAFIAAQGWELVGTYVDDGRSAKAGKLEERDGFARLVRDAELGRFDVLVVVDIDRLTRTDDMRERAAILGPFQTAGIRIVTPAGGELDLRTFLGEFYVTMQAMFAAEENRKRAERIKAGKARAIAEGRKPAGPTPYGHAYDRETGTWSIDEPAAALSREIFHRVAGGESCVMIADDLIRRDAKPAPRTGWSRAAVYRIVRKRSVAGEWQANKAQGAVIRVPSIVTEGEWQAAQRALIAHNRRGLVRTKHFYLLEGLARCVCGAPIHIRSASPGRRGYVNPPAYVCRARRFGRTCNEPIVRCADLDARVWAAIADELVQDDLRVALAEVQVARAVTDNVDAWRHDAEQYRARIAKLDKVEAALMVRFRVGAIGEAVLDGELAAIMRERRALRLQLQTAEKAIGSTLSAQTRQLAAIATVERFRDALPSATPEQRRALLRELTSDGGVVISGGNARLDLRLLLSTSATSDDRADRPAAISLVRANAYRNEHEYTGGAVLRIRRVA